MTRPQVWAAGKVLTFTFVGSQVQIYEQDRSTFFSGQKQPLAQSPLVNTILTHVPFSGIVKP